MDNIFQLRPYLPNKAAITVSSHNTFTETQTDIVSAKEKQVRELLGQQYDAILATPEDNVINAIEKGFFPTASPITFDGEYNFTLLSQQLDLPNNVTLNEVRLSGGSLSFHSGSLFVFGANTVGYATGNNAIVLACAAGSCAVAAATGAKAIAAVPNSYAFGTAKGVYVSGANGGQAFGFDVLEQYLQELKERADEGNREACYDLGMSSLTGIFPLILPKSEAIGYFMQASDEGHSLASYQLGLMNLTGTQVIPQNLKLAEVLFQRAYHQDESADKAFKFGELFMPFFSKTISFDSKLKTGSSIAYEWHKKAAEKGHLQAIQRIADYKSSSLNFDKILFGIADNSAT
jgi:hypothetical protein